MSTLVDRAKTIIEMRDRYRTEFPDDYPKRVERARRILIASAAAANESVENFFERIVNRVYSTPLILAPSARLAVFGFAAALCDIVAERVANGEIKTDPLSAATPKNR